MVFKLFTIASRKLRVNTLKQITAKANDGLF